MNRIVRSWWQRRGYPDKEFEALLAPMIPPMYRLAWRLTGNTEDAEDLLQDLLLRVYPRRHELAALDQLRPWLARVLYRLYVDRYRHMIRSPLVPMQSEDQDNDDTALDRYAADAGLEPEQKLEQSVMGERLQRALNALPEDQREIVMLHDVEGYTLPELMQILDTALGTLKSRLHRAREKLRGWLEDGTF